MPLHSAPDASTVIRRANVNDEQAERNSIPPKTTEPHPFRSYKRFLKEPSAEAAILIMAAGGTKNRLKPGLRGFGVPALAGGGVARSGAVKFFLVILFVCAPPPQRR